MFRIDKTIPPPPSRAANYKYPFDRLEVGDSIFLADKRSRAEFSGSLYQLKPKRFVSRMVTEKGKVGVRVWRIE
jgi:hypothetical protein